MKTISIIRKSIKEQWRSYWIWILTISLAPFFVLIYNLISSSYAPRLDVLILNNDNGYSQNGQHVSLGDEMTGMVLKAKDSLANKLLFFHQASDKLTAEKKLKNSEADLLLIIPENFTQLILTRHGQVGEKIPIEFIGNTTKMDYVLSAIWTHELVSKYVYARLSMENPISLKETSLGSSGQRTDFELAVPGLMIFAIIMLMFSASIAIVNEIEKGTIIRFRMAPVSSAQLLTGISVVQVILGIISAFLTLGVAAVIGFRMQGSFWLILLIAILTGISIIAFSLILASFSKSANQILIVGNFPFFIFMFLSGAMFPLNTATWFTIGGYPIAINSILSSVHAVSALNKVILMQMGLRDIIPEILALIILSALYFALGVWAFQYRHLRRK